MASAMTSEIDFSKSIRNPFRGSVLGDAWMADGDHQDVASIHRSAFEKCCEAVEWVRSGQYSAGIVIHGEAGSGKTHLIRRLRHRFTDRFAHPTLERISQCFAYVPLYTHYTSLARHTRRCVAIDLLRTISKGPSQLERLVIAQLMSVAEGGGDLAMWWENLRDEHDDDIDELLFSLGQQENLSPNFVRVLTHFVRNRHRLEVAGWLRGDALTDSAYERLEIAPCDPESDPETDARRVLTDLMKLAGPEVPLVLCFDQVEALQNDRSDTRPFFAYAQLLVNLHGADTNLVLISCMQTEFSREIVSAVPEYARARIQSYATCSLTPLDIGQARELLALRLGPVGTIAPLTDDELQHFVGPNGLCNPRLLLDRAARRFDQIIGRVPPEREKSLPEWLGEEWERRSEKATQENQPEGTGETLRHGIPLLIQVVDPQWTTANGKHNVAIDYLLTGPQKEAQVGIKICEDDANRLFGPLRTLSNLYPDRMKLQKLVLLRDERSPISKNATKTREFLDNLEKKDALFYRVPPEALAALDALRRLLAESRAGDLDFDGSVVSPESVIEWLRHNLPCVLKEMADLLITPGTVDKPFVHVDQLQEFLADTCIATVTEAAARIGASADELLKAATDRGDLFGIVRGEPTVIFSVRLGSRCLTSASTD